jgi:hypothetical protein
VTPGGITGFSRGLMDHADILDHRGERAGFVRDASDA